MVNTRCKTKKMKQKEFNQQSTQLSAFIDSNDDLLTEILLRLPVKSIIRFKSVSKRWRFLLSHRHFTNRYDNNNLLKSPGLFAHDIYIPFDVENQRIAPFRHLDFCYDRYGITIIQSCNGLVLCCNSGWNRKYYVINPTTKQFAIIPSIRGGQKARQNIMFMGLAFHQTHCVHYKLVCIHALENKDSCQIQIYSSDTKKWKISTESIIMGYDIFSSPVYWNGAVHWATFHRGYFYFKIDDEQLQKLPLPVGLESSNPLTMYFGESRGHLHLILRPNDDEKCLIVYEMLSDLSGWFVKFQIQLDELLGVYPEMFHWQRRGYFNVIDVVRGEQQKDTFIVLNAYNEIVTYDVHGKTLKHIFTLNGYFDKYAKCFPRYMETLACF